MTLLPVFVFVTSSYMLRLLALSKNRKAMLPARVASFFEVKPQTMIPSAIVFLVGVLAIGEIADFGHGPPSPFKPIAEPAAYFFMLPHYIFNLTTVPIVHESLALKIPVLIGLFVFALFYWYSIGCGIYYLYNRLSKYRHENVQAQAQKRSVRVL